MNEDSLQAQLNTALVALGRMEEKLNNMAGIDERLRQLETTVTRIEAQQRPKAPWYVVLAAVVGIITGVSSLVGLLVIFSQLVTKIGT